jgi:hypothetical protein
MTHQLTETSNIAVNKPPATAKRPTRKAQFIKLLSRKAGADVETISDKFGWQPHTTRAALSGLRKIGFELTKDCAGSGRAVRYRIVTGSKVEAAADVPNDQ